MILTAEHVTALMGSNEAYNCELLKQRFSYFIFQDKLSPIGNVICFDYPTNIGSLHFKKAIIIAGEIPNSNMFGGVCFQRLYTAQLGSIFAEVFGTPCNVDGSVILVEDKQANVSVTNRVKDSTLLHNIFSVESDIEGMYNLNQETEKIELFKEKAINSFKYLINSIFIETQRDNF
jgi:hypothetical protein